MSFADLHRPGRPFVLPNAWDLGSARALAAAGFPAVGTTSLGLAASHGLVDAAGDTQELTGTLARALATAGLPCPVSVDIEDGFSPDPADVAGLVARLGVDGVNIEDSTRGVLVDPERHAAKIAAVKATCPEVFVNARTDTYWLGATTVETLARTVSRARRYVAAGADGVFVPGDLDADTVRAITSAVDRPVNVLASARMTRDELGRLGVARISTGSLLYRSALARTLEAAVAVRDSLPVPGAVPYDEVQALHAGRAGRPGPGVAVGQGRQIS